MFTRFMRWLTKADERERFRAVCDARDIVFNQLMTIDKGPEFATGLRVWERLKDECIALIAKNR